nr:hypothetical protein [Tanacetum cinerariifolium]
MLDRTDFTSWQQQIRLYCRGKENRVNISKSIDEGPYRMGIVKETLAESIEGAPQFTSSSTQVPQPLTDSSLSPTEDLIKNLTNTLALLTQSYKTFLPQTNNQLRTSSNERNQATVHDGRVVTRIRNVNPGQARPVKCYNCNGRHDNAFDDDVDEQPVQDLALNVDNVFQADDYDVFDSDMDEAPTAQTIFMANLSTADLITDEARPSYVSDILFEVHDHDHYQDAACAHHEEHVMHDSVQPDHVVDSHVVYTSDSNMISYDQYAKDNEVPVVHSDVSSVPNDSFMMIYNDMCEPHPQSVSNPLRNTVVKNSLTAELATYKEQVELYERWAKFELTEQELKINEKLRLVISDHNFKEETLKKELHSIKLQLASTINHYKSIVEEVTPKPHYNELNRVATGYKNPLCLTHAKQVQPALYNGHGIIKDNHTPAIVHNTEDTLEIAEITKKKMNDKMNDPERVTRKLKFEALKEWTKVSRPIKALTVYPSNTPATLVPKVLLTKSQVKIHIFTLIQLFLEFDKICKKRITPTGLTEGERGLEQTKECYLIEVIPFFKTLKDNFEGIQKALTKEIKEMKDVFEELEAEVAQYVVDRKHDAIEWKNLLIANDNLIVECLSQEVFSVATNSELNVARFTEMHVANTTVEARCLALEAELANLCDKNNHDNQKELINNFSKLEHYKELYDSIKITRVKHIDQVTKLTTKNVNLKTSVSKDKVNPQVLVRDKHAIDVEPIVPRLRNNKDAYLDYLRHLKESDEIIRDIVEEAMVSAMYNGHEILKDNHARAKVRNTKDTLEIAEITRKKINAKMTDPECVTHKVKIAPHDFSKENLLATFTPQKQLTAEQIYWSNDLMKLKSEALKEWAKVSRPIKAFTVYPPNTPATLVPKVLPTISQVKIHIFTLIQLFSEFDKTCKKRITPSAITDGERGFEQTKACYLQEAIPFFQTIKDNSEGKRQRYPPIEKATLQVTSDQ